MIQNIGKLLYKDYYSGIDFEYVMNESKEGSQDCKIARKNDKIKQSGLVTIANSFARLLFSCENILSWFGYWYRNYS